MEFESNFNSLTTQDSEIKNILICMGRTTGRTYTIFDAIATIDAYKRGHITYEEIMGRLMNNKHPNVR